MVSKTISCLNACHNFYEKNLLQNQQEKIFGDVPDQVK
jgi:hypothetical protein